MGAIAIAPSDPNIVYAGTGEGDTQSPLGVGLLHSGDGGRTWSHLPSPELDRNAIYDIAIDPQDAQILYVGSVYGLHRSDSGGVTWDSVFTLPPDKSLPVWDISINPNAPDEVYAATAVGLLTSTKRGVTGSWSWVVLPNQHDLIRLEVFHAPSDPDVVYVFGAQRPKANETPANISKLWRKDKGAAGFNDETLPFMIENGQAWYDWCGAAHPSDENVIYLGSIHLYRCQRDPAGSWQVENIASRKSGDSIHPDQHFITFDPSDPDTMYVANDGGLFVSPNGGTDWKPLNTGLGITEFEYLAQHPHNTDWILGGTQDNGTLSRRASTVWDQVAQGDGGDCGVNDAVPDTCYHTYYRLGMERSLTGGKADSWEWVGPNSSAASLFYPPMEVSGDVVCQAGSSVHVSSDRGDTWVEIPLPQPSSTSQWATSILIIDASLILVGTNIGYVHELTSSAGIWSQPTSSSIPRPDAVISDIAADPSDTDRIWTTSSFTTGKRVFFSDTKGKSWHDKTAGIPDTALNAVVVDPADSDTIYIGADNGVYRTANGGSTWEDLSGNLPNAIVGDLIFHQSRLLRAATRSRGVWEVAV